MDKVQEVNVWTDWIFGFGPLLSIVCITNEKHAAVLLRSRAGLTCVMRRDDECVFVLSFSVQRSYQVQLTAGREAERSRVVPAAQGVADLTVSAQIVITGHHLRHNTNLI